MKEGDTAPLRLEPVAATRSILLPSKPVCGCRMATIECFSQGAVPGVPCAGIREPGLTDEQ